MLKNFAKEEKQMPRKGVVGSNNMHILRFLIHVGDLPSRQNVTLRGAGEELYLQ